MSRIYNLAATVDDRYKDNNFKDREIKAFEIKYPETAIIREKYDSEKQLQDDWQKYCESPYHLKVLANELCLRLFGVKNEQQYIKLKAEFTKKDISNNDIWKNTYVPEGFTEESEIDQDWLNKQAKDYMQAGGHNILHINYDNLADLHTDWYNFNNQCYDYKTKANNKSLEIFGKKVPEVYQIELHKFLKKDIPMSSLDDLETYPITNSLAAIESVCDAIEKTSDPVEGILFLESIKKENLSPVEQSIVELTETHLHEWINDKKENYLGQYNFLLPYEMINIVEDPEILFENEMFLNYCARGIGLSPPMKMFQEKMRIALNEEQSPEKLFMLGWNPVLEVKEENKILSSMRANKVLRENMNTLFFDLSSMPDLLMEEEIDDEFHKGISVIMIQELDQDNKEIVEDLPKVLMTLDYRDSFWNPLIYGQFFPKQSVDMIINQFKAPCVSCFFVGLGDPLYDKMKSMNIENFNDHNIIQKLCALLQVGCPHIGNKKLFFYYLLNALLQNDEIQSLFPKLNSTISIQILYSKLFGKYDEILRSYSKLGLFKSKGAALHETSFFKDIQIVLNEENIITDKADYFRLSNTIYNESWSDFKKLFAPKIQI